MSAGVPCRSFAVESVRPVVGNGKAESIFDRLMASLMSCCRSPRRKSSYCNHARYSFGRAQTRKKRICSNFLYPRSHARNDSAMPNAADIDVFISPSSP